MAAAKEAEKELQRLRKQQAQNETVLAERQSTLAGLRTEMAHFCKAPTKTPTRK